MIRLNQGFNRRNWIAGIIRQQIIDSRNHFKPGFDFEECERKLLYASYTSLYLNDLAVAEVDRLALSITLKIKGLAKKRWNEFEYQLLGIDDEASNLRIVSRRKKIQDLMLRCDTDLTEMYEYVYKKTEPDRTLFRFALKQQYDNEKIYDNDMQVTLEYIGGLIVLAMDHLENMQDMAAEFCYKPMIDKYSMRPDLVRFKRFLDAQMKAGARFMLNKSSAQVSDALQAMYNKVTAEKFVTEAISKVKTISDDEIHT